MSTRDDPWSYPENTADQLWISSAGDERSFGQLLEDIHRHFGDDSSLAEFNIEYTQWAHKNACGCCRDSGINGDYLVITRRKKPCEYTSNLLLADLYRD